MAVEQNAKGSSAFSLITRMYSSSLDAAGVTTDVSTFTFKATAVGNPYSQNLADVWSIDETGTLINNQAY